jgi:hypothetical protein
MAFLANGRTFLILTAITSEIRKAKFEFWSLKVVGEFIDRSGC